MTARASWSHAVDGMTSALRARRRPHLRRHRHHHRGERRRLFHGERPRCDLRALHLAPGGADGLCLERLRRLHRRPLGARRRALAPAGAGRLRHPARDHLEGAARPGHARGRSGLDRPRPLDALRPDQCRGARASPTSLGRTPNRSEAAAHWARPPRRRSASPTTGSPASIVAVGNYGQIFDRNLGEASPLAIRARHQRALDQRAASSTPRRCNRRPRTVTARSACRRPSLAALLALLAFLMLVAARRLPRAPTSRSRRPTVSRSAPRSSTSSPTSRTCRFRSASGARRSPPITATARSPILWLGEPRAGRFRRLAPERRRGRPRPGRLSGRPARQARRGGRRDQCRAARRSSSSTSPPPSWNTPPTSRSAASCRTRSIRTSSRRAGRIDQLAALTLAARSPRASTASSLAWQPQAPEYAALRAALADYRALAGAGGWPTVPLGESLKPGMSDPRVPALRARLAVTDGADPASAARRRAGSTTTRWSRR